MSARVLNWLVAVATSCCSTLNPHTGHMTIYVGNKMHKAFPLPGESFHWQYKFPLPVNVKDFKGMTFEEIEAKFVEVWKQVENFIPMGSKEETKRLKRKGLNLEQEQVKKQKSSEEAPEIKTSTVEFTKEKMKEMMQLIFVEDIIRLGGSSACYQFFVDLLKQLDREDLNQLWALVKEYLSIRPATKWKLYDLSGVHHLTAKDKEIFMLVEKIILSEKFSTSNLEQEDAKRQRLEEENETIEFKKCLEIILEYDNDVTIEATPISSKSPTIVDYKIYKEGKKAISKSSE
uniref:Uncharacterized protein n=1 Tax=Tanacetum cinerariifolium TaxID=118510 RepID=A0A6L2NTI0_TANCI|nr:hypothetical protein [Tanacetum cinerariifolium]